MTDRDRIAEIIRNARMFADPLSQVGYAEADALLANGFILPPCKVGDTVYYPSFNVGAVFEYKIVSIKLNSKGLYIVLDNRLRNEQMTHNALQIGKTVFLTKEEAEEKLRELG